MQVTAKKLLLLVLRDESSRALFEFLHILPTSYVCVCVCVGAGGGLKGCLCVCVSVKRFVWFQRFMELLQHRTQHM